MVGEVGANAKGGRGGWSDNSTTTMKTMLMGDINSILVGGIICMTSLEGRGFIGTQALHSSVNLLHKSLSDMLQIHKEHHSLALFS